MTKKWCRLIVFGMQAGSLRISLGAEDCQRLNHRADEDLRTPKAEAEWLVRWALDELERRSSTREASEAA